VNVSVCLTDQYPNLGALRLSNQCTPRSITYHPQPVDEASSRGADRISDVLYSLPPFHADEARAVLSDAVQKRQGIAVFECTEQRPPMLVMLLAADGAGDDAIHPAVSLVTVALDLPDSGDARADIIRWLGVVFADLQRRGVT
jgi:hypothetical protein